MKLSKNKLISILKQKLESFCFSYFPDSIFCSQGTFIRKLDNDLYLTLSLTIHRYYESMFTADYFLSTTTRVGSVWGDIPKESYERVSFLLTKNELEKFTKEGCVVVRDIWWDAFDDNSINEFLEVIALTNKRFAENVVLIKEIKQSKELMLLTDLVKGTIYRIKTNSFSEYTEFLPNKSIDDIPLKWFKAAESEIRGKKEILNQKTVNKLAADAYRQFCLKGDEISTLLVPNG